MVLDEEAEPPPTCPGELRQILDERQTLGSAGNDQQVVVATQPQIAVQELLESRLEAMITAMHHQGARRLALEFGVDLIGRHGHPRVGGGPCGPLSRAPTRGDPYAAPLTLVLHGGLADTCLCEGLGLGALMFFGRLMPARRLMR